MENLLLWLEKYGIFIATFINVVLFIIAFFNARSSYISSRISKKAFEKASIPIFTGKRKRIRNNVYPIVLQNTGQACTLNSSMEEIDPEPFRIERAPLNKSVVMGYGDKIELKLHFKNKIETQIKIKIAFSSLEKKSEYYLQDLIVSPEKRRLLAIPPVRFDESFLR